MGEHSLLFDTMIYLAAAVVFVPMAKRFGLGSVLGYLAAGCVIGPFGLRFVTDVHSIMHFAEFGVVLMLFMIGLELDPMRLWGMRRAVFGGGALQLAACGVPMAGAALGIGMSWKTALIVGFSLALSSTAIAMQSMAERNLSTSPLGRSSFAILLFQDIAAIPLIAMVPMLAEKTNATSGSSWAGPLTVLGAVVGVVLIGRYLTRPVLQIVARTHMREVFTAFTLLLVVGISQIMSFAGVSMALGAFLAGVLLASSEYRHALETDIAPFKGLLMGLFFIAVGMSIDFGLLARQPLLILALLLSFLAIKGLAIALIAKRMDVSRKQRWLFAALLGQGGEFAFVVFGVAREAHLLPGDWEGRLTLVVALSMAATPLLLVLLDWLATRAACEEAEKDDEIQPDDAPVIIAGFGRFGQIIGRLLFASGVRATVLDHDPDQIEMLRRFGFRIFYGDATRIELLEAAGIAHARVLVVAIDDMDTALSFVDEVQKHFPHVQIVARARNVTHYQELRKRGVVYVERELFESSLSAGRRTLEALGVARYEARERSDRFRRHNIAQLEALREFMDDDKERFSRVQTAREELTAQFHQDQAALDRMGIAGWQEDLAAEELEGSEA